MAKTSQLRRAFSQLDISKQDQDYLIPALLGFMINGVETVEVANRPGYVYVRVRSNLNEVIQVFNDRVAPVYDLPVLMIRDPNNPTRYKIEGRDVGRYENWGTSAPFLPSHGNTHSFDPAGRGGGDMTWVYSQQIMPWNVIPSGTYGSGNVLISGYPRYLTSWEYAGNTGTSSLLSYKPTGSSARMVLVYMDGSNNPKLTAGSLFSASISGTYGMMPYIPSTPSGTTIPLAAVRLDANTTTIMWDDIIDLRPFFTGVGGGTSSTTVDVDGLHQELIRMWDYSANQFVTFANSDAGFASALAAAADNDVIYLPIAEFSGPIVLTKNIAIIGTIASRGYNRTRIAGPLGNPVLTITGSSSSTWLENLRVDNYSSGPTGSVVIEANSKDITMVNVNVISTASDSAVGSALAMRHGSHAFTFNCVFGGLTTGGYSNFPFDVAPQGTYSIYNDGVSITTTRTRNIFIGDNDASYLTTSTTGTISFAGVGGIRIPRKTTNVSNPPSAAELNTVFGSPSGSGAGFLALIDDNGAGTNEYLVVSDGTNWFYSTLTKAV